MTLIAGLLPALQVVSVSQLINSLARPSETSIVLWWIVATGLIVGLARALTDVTMTTGQILGETQRIKYHELLTNRVAQLYPEELRSSNTLAKARESREGVDRHVAHMADFVIATVKAVVAVGGLIAAIWAIDWRVALLIGFSGIPAIIGFSYVSKWESKSWPKLSEESRRAKYLEDQLMYPATASDLSGLGSGQRIAKLASLNYVRRAKLYAYMNIRSLIVIGSAGLVSAVFLVAALVILAYSGNVQPAAVAAGVVGVLSGTLAVADAGFTFGMVLTAAPTVGRFRSFTDDDSSTRQPIRVTTDLSAIGANNLTVIYPGQDVPALHSVSIAAHQGEMIGIVGVNGAGKTTLVSALQGNLSAESGTVTLGGRELVEMSRDEVLGIFGTLTQDYGRFELPARDAVCLGLPADSADSMTPEELDARVWSALEAARLGDFFRSQPRQLETMLGEQWDGIGLSGGQWQRLALARIFFRDAAVRVLDEPTSAIDAEAEREIFDTLADSRSGHITIVVSHRAWTLRRADRIYVLDKGQLVQEGNYQTLMAQPGRFRDIFLEQTDPNRSEENPGQEP